MMSRYSLLIAAVAASAFRVDVYEGPTECEKPVQKMDYLVMHYTGTIDESSQTGIPGTKFDSSRDRGQTFDF